VNLASVLRRALNKGYSFEAVIGNDLEFLWSGSFPMYPQNTIDYGKLGPGVYLGNSVLDAPGSPLNI